MTNMTRPEFYDESGEHKQVVGKDSVGTLEDLKEINTENINISDSINVNKDNFKVDQNGNVTANGDVNVNGNIKTVKGLNVNNKFTVDNTGQVAAKKYEGVKSQIGHIILEGNTITAIKGERINIPDYRLYRHVITLTNVQGGNCINGTLFFTVYSDQDTKYTNLRYLLLASSSVDGVGFPCTGGGRNAQASTYYYFSYLHIDEPLDNPVVTVQSQMSNNSNATLTLTQYSIKDEVFRIL